MLILTLVFSYILGSIPFGLIITKIQGIDLRNIGSGNIGTTNVLRTGNKMLAALSLFMDSLKGFIAVCISTSQQYAAILAVLGHMFPIWIKFRGGKGVATTLGILLGCNMQIALIFLFTWVVVFFAFRYSSLASLSATAVATIASFFLSKDLLLTLCIITVLVFCKHYQNIINLYKGSEYKF